MGSASGSFPFREPRLFAGEVSIFNVKDYGATGIKADNAQTAIQKAIDACGKAGGGMVYLPPGEYTSGILHLRSHVRFHIEGGATLYASKDMSLFTGTHEPTRLRYFLPTRWRMLPSKAAGRWMARAHTNGERTIWTTSLFAQQKT